MSGSSYRMSIGSVLVINRSDIVAFTLLSYFDVNI